MGRWTKLRRKGLASVLAMSMGMGSFLILPAPRPAEADLCGANDGKQCAHASVCVGFWIFKSCTETWKYYLSETAVWV